MTGVGVGVCRPRVTWERLGWPSAENWADGPSYYCGGGYSGSSATESGPIETADRLLQTNG